jgi:hypothetical protein
MLSRRWSKWGLLFAGTTVAALQLGACIARTMLDYWLLRSVN